MLLGIDIGGTSIKFAVFDDNYKIVHYETCKTPDNITVQSRKENNQYKATKDNSSLLQSIIRDSHKRKLK